MEEEIRALLLATGGVTNLCGTRINFGERPQGQALPALVLNTVSATEGLHMNGKGPHDARIQVDCYATTPRARTLLARAVLARLNAYRGGGFLFIEHADTRDTREGGTNEVTRTYRAGMDFLVTWRAE